MKCLTVGIFLTLRIGPLPLRESRVQQYIQLLIVGEDIGVTEPPFAIRFSKLGECCPALLSTSAAALLTIASIFFACSDVGGAVRGLAGLTAATVATAMDARTCLNMTLSF